MTPKVTHAWNLSEEEALSLQSELSRQVILQDEFDPDPKLIAGVDVAYSKHTDQLFAAVVVLDAKTLAVVETKTAMDIERFPYIPGLFSFREIPALAKALFQLENTPQIIVCDGQGIAHPRRFGLASHLGVMFDVPTIGCAKTRLIGHSPFTPRQRGETAPLLDGEEIIGSVLCTQDDTKPVYISSGHKISVESACQWILALAPKYRLPETTRKANETVNLLRNSTI